MSIPQEVLGKLLPLVQEFEGCRLEAYQDPRGTWTVGWGHTGPEVLPGLVWTQAQADSTLATDLGSHYNALRNCSPTVVRLSAGRQAALTDFVYNEGIGHYEHSTLRSAVDSGAWLAVRTQLGKWIYVAGQKSAGLSRRRDREIALIDA